MQVSYSWLQDFVDTHLAPEALGQRFLMTSSELEGIVDWTQRFAHVYVAEVLTCVPVEGSKKLKLTTIQADKKRTVICGAPNVAAGQKVLVATPGAKLINLDGSVLDIQEATVFGHKSEGMLCGAPELGLDLRGDGLLILPDDAKPGTPAAEYLKLNTAVLDLEITPNRPDLLSHFGLAREVAAFEKKMLKQPELAEFSTKLPQTIDLTIDNPQATKRFSAINFSVTPGATTPWWMQARLLSVGMRPVSPIVDVTNYVMLELGQPLHAFDTTHITRSGRIILSVDTIKKETPFTALDGIPRTLDHNDVVITTGTQINDIAGIMGGKDSAITDTTTSFTLTAVNFNGAFVRRTSRRLRIRTEASGRFEKGIDPELTILALQRAAHLYETLGMATVSSRLADIYPHSKTSKSKIHVSGDRIMDILGIHISLSEAKSILQKLGFEVSSVSKSALDCTPPSWRADVLVEEDVLEELVRIWGFERIPSTLPVGSVKAPALNPTFYAKKQFRFTGAKLGFQEVLHLPFTNKQQLTRLGMAPEQAVPLQNPLSGDQSHLIMTHLLPMLTTVAANQKEETSKLFEIGATFHLPLNETMTWTALNRSGDNANQLLQELKELIEVSCRNAGLLGKIAYTVGLPKHEAYSVFQNGLEVFYEGKKAGWIRLLTPATVDTWKIRRGRIIMAAMLDLDILFSFNAGAHSLFQPLPTFPAIERDLTLIVDRNLSWELVVETLTKHNSPILSDWHFVSQYTGKPLTDTQKSFTIHFTYLSPERTLSDTEVDADQQTITNLTQTTLKATVS